MESKLTQVRLKHRFHSALSRGRRQRLWCKVRGCNPYPLSLELVLLGKVVTRRTARKEQVPLNKIRGSVGRATDYSANFLPLKSSDESRWVRIAESLEGPGLPPVRLLHYRQTYFVDDGHHRVSVLRFFRANSVSAEVIDLVDISMPVATDPSSKPIFELKC